MNETIIGYMTPCNARLARYGDIWQAYFICTPDVSQFQVNFKFLESYFICTPDVSQFQVNFKFLESFITHLMCVF